MVDETWQAILNALVWIVQGMCWATGALIIARLWGVV